MPLETVPMERTITVVERRFFELLGVIYFIWDTIRIFELGQEGGGLAAFASHLAPGPYQHRQDPYSP